VGFGDQLKKAWDSQDPQVVAALYQEDGVREEFILTRARLEGRDQIALQVGMYMTAVPDCWLEIRREITAGNGTITIEWTWGGNHTGDIEGWPARDERVVLPGVGVYDMAGDLIRRENIYTDFAIMLAGAGLIPGLEAPPG
jgi:steroid delta-isomerase-like uncharacterized protein